MIPARRKPCVGGFSLRPVSWKRDSVVFMRSSYDQSRTQYRKEQIEGGIEESGRIEGRRHDAEEGIAEPKQGKEDDEGKKGDARRHFFAYEKNRQAGQDERGEEFIEFRRVDRIDDEESAGVCNELVSMCLTENGKGHTPGQPRFGAETAPVQETFDTHERDAYSEDRCPAIGEFPGIDTEEAKRQPPDQSREDDAAEKRETARPEIGDPIGMREERVPVDKDVQKPTADERRDEHREKRHGDRSSGEATIPRECKGSEEPCKRGERHEKSIG